MHIYCDGIHYDYEEPLMEKSGTSSNAWIHCDYGDPNVNHDDDSGFLLWWLRIGRENDRLGTENQTVMMIVIMIVLVLVGRLEGMCEISRL